MRTVKDIFFGGKNIRGEVGIEIEMEGENFPMEDLDSWYSREDGSLRGKQIEDSREYVLIRPCKRDDVSDRLLSLQNDLKEHGSVIGDSYRTGVHVHVNCRAMTFNEVFNFIFTYLMFEDILMEYAGKERVGNLFCLRASDAELVLDTISKAITEKNLTLLHTDNIRYSSMNLKALKQYGSIEFRGLPFSGDFEQIKVWTKLLLAVKDYSLTLETPRNLVENISKLGAPKLAKEVFEDLHQHLPADKWHLMLEGVRRVQKLVFLNDWDDRINYLTIKTNLEIKDENIKQDKQDGKDNWQNLEPAVAPRIRANLAQAFGAGIR